MVNLLSKTLNDTFVVMGLWTKVTSADTKKGQVQVEELQGVQKTIQAFIAAFKSFSLYPEDHVFCRTNLEKFYQSKSMKASVNAEFLCYLEQKKIYKCKSYQL